MARPQKTGIDYFYFDCDFFENRKVRKILKGCGLQGITILSYLLCNIYKSGYYITWDDEESTFDISDSIGVSDGAVSELVKKAIEVEFFSKKMYEKHRILTSAAIQEIYFDACKRRDVIKYDKRYILIPVNVYTNAVNVYINPKNVDSGTQSKVEEIKEEESKEDSGAGPPTKSFKNFTDVDFMNEVLKFKDKYPQEMRNMFYKYWKEKNSKGKMRFQLEKTWETELRLEKWANNNQISKNGTPTANGSGKKELSTGRDFSYDPL